MIDDDVLKKIFYLTCKGISLFHGNIPFKMHISLKWGDLVIRFDLRITL